MLEDRFVFINREFVAWQKATVHMMCHSFARGSAVFEVLSLHASASGPAVFRLQDHIERLFKSARHLDMQLPLSRDEFYEAVVGTVRKNSLQKGFIKIICYYPQVAVEISPPAKILDVAVFALDPAVDFEGIDFPEDAIEKGISACLSSWRKLDPQTVPIEAKAAANYLNGMVAQGEAQRRGFDQAIMLDTQGFVAEGGTESVFIVKDSRLLTPALGTVLQSITRRSILQVARTEGIETVEARLRPELLAEADEIFTASTPFKVFPVRQMDGRVLGDVPGPLTRRLSGLMQNIAAGTDERFKDWLFPVG
jgi:branched-chain amino acid aminotransferase